MLYLIPTYVFPSKFKQVYDQSDRDLKIVEITKSYNDFVAEHNMHLDIKVQMPILSTDGIVLFEVEDTLPTIFKNHYNPRFDPDMVGNIIQKGIPCVYPLRILKKGAPFNLYIDDKVFECLIPIIDHFREPRELTFEESLQCGYFYEDNEDFMNYLDCWGGRVRYNINLAYTLISS